MDLDALDAGQSRALLGTSAIDTPVGGPGGSVVDVLLMLAPMAFLVTVTVSPRLHLPTSHSVPIATATLYLFKLGYLGAPPNAVNAAVFQGALLGLVPLSILFGAFFFYNVLRLTQCTAYISKLIKELCHGHPVAEVLLIVWALGHLIEGASGFGTPGALLPPLAMGLGHDPFSCVVALLIATTTVGPFGSSGIGIWFGLSALHWPREELVHATFLVAITMAVMSYPIALLSARFMLSWADLRGCWLFVLLSITSGCAPALCAALFSYEVPALLSGVAAVTVTGLLARYRIGLSTTVPALLDRQQQQEEESARRQQGQQQEQPAMQQQRQKAEGEVHIELGPVTGFGGSPRRATAGPAKPIVEESTPRWSLQRPGFGTLRARTIIGTTTSSLEAHLQAQPAKTGPSSSPVGPELALVAPSSSQPNSSPKRIPQQQQVGPGAGAGADAGAARAGGLRSARPAPPLARTEAQRSPRQQRSSQQEARKSGDGLTQQGPSRASSSRTSPLTTADSSEALLSPQKGPMAAPYLADRQPGTRKSSSSRSSLGGPVQILHVDTSAPHEGADSSQQQRPANKEEGQGAWRSAGKRMEGAVGLGRHKPLMPWILMLAVVAGTRIPYLQKSNGHELRISLKSLCCIHISSNLVVTVAGILGEELSWSYALLYVPSLLPFISVGCVTLLAFRKDLPAGASWADPFRNSWDKCRGVLSALLSALMLVALIIQGGSSSPAFIIGYNLSSWLKKGYIAVSMLLGATGAFFSGSVATSNLTFGVIQEVAAGRLGLPAAPLIMLQIVGGAAGQMISISNILGARAVVGLQHIPEGRFVTAALPACLLYYVVGILISLPFLLA